MKLAHWKTTAFSGAVLLALTAFTPATASAQAVITNGSGVALGIDTLGQMNPSGLPEPDGSNPYNVGGPVVGLSFFTNYTGSGAVWGDATSPGCLCEGFGVSANGVAGYADNATGIVNLSSDGFTSTSSTAVANAHLTTLPGITISQDYHPSASSSLYEDTVTITNNTGLTATDVRYNRTMDWDIPPTTFDELVTIQGWPATALLNSCDDGFQTPNPLVDSDCITGDAVHNGNFTDSGPNDHGARFTFGFGDLADGQSVSFNVYYGAASSERAALAALGTVGAEVYSFGQCDPGAGVATCSADGTPATFIFGFSGVGGTPVSAVPEPASLALLGTGLAGLIRRRRNRKA